MRPEGRLTPRILWPLLLVAACVLAYANSFHGVFIFDDEYTVRNGCMVRQAWTSGRGILITGRPVVDATFALHCGTGELRAADFHAFNLLVHVLNALLLYALICQLLPVARSAAGQGTGQKKGVAFSCALLWACHPLGTGAVTYISQRYESLMATFYVATLYAVARVCRAGGRRALWGWSAAAVIACALGMGSKEVMVTAPVAAILLDWFFYARGSWRALACRWGLYLALASCWIVLVVLIPVNLRPQADFNYSWSEASPVLYLATQAGVICRYLRLALWPRGLCFDHACPVVTGLRQAILPGAAIVTMLVATVAGVWRRRAWAFPAACFFLVLAPTSSVIPRATAMAEYRMYLPLAAVIALVVLGLRCLIHAGAQRFDIRFEMRRALCAGLLAVTTVLLATLAFRRNDLYQSEERLWRSVIEVHSGNLRAHLGIGAALLRRGELDEAEARLQYILDELPQIGGPGSAPGHAVTIYAQAYNNLGALHSRRGRYDAAEACFREALRVAPVFRRARRNLDRLVEWRAVKED